MPEMRFRIRWPDGTVMSCYSPSLVIKDFFNVGAAYSIADFLTRCTESLTIASERVKAKYGFYCTSAAAQLQEITAYSRKFADVLDAQVVIEAFDTGN